MPAEFSLTKYSLHMLTRTPISRDVGCKEARDNILGMGVKPCRELRRCKRDEVEEIGDGVRIERKAAYGIQAPSVTVRTNLQFAHRHTCHEDVIAYTRGPHVARIGLHPSAVRAMSFCRSHSRSVCPLLASELIKNADVIH